MRPSTIFGRAPLSGLPLWIRLGPVDGALRMAMQLGVDAVPIHGHGRTRVGGGDVHGEVLGHRSSTSAAGLALVRNRDHARRACRRHGRNPPATPEAPASRRVTRLTTTFSPNRLIAAVTFSATVSPSSDALSSEPRRYRRSRPSQPTRRADCRSRRTHPCARQSPSRNPLRSSRRRCRDPDRNGAFAGRPSTALARFGLSALAQQLDGLFGVAVRISRALVCNPSCPRRSCRVAP